MTETASGPTQRDLRTGETRLGHSQRRHRTQLLFLAFLLVLAGMGGRWLVLSANARHAAMQERVAQSQATVGLYRSVLTSLLDAQNGGRGYVVTGNEEFLVQYHAALAELELHLRTAARLGAERPDLKPQLGDLAELARQAASLIVRAPEARRREGFAAAQAIVSSGEGQRSVEAVRDLVTGEVERETELLGRLRTSESEAERRSRRATDVILVTGVAALAAALWLIRREGARRLQVEREIEQSRGELQQSVRSLSEVLREREQLQHLSELLHTCRSLEEIAAVVRASLPKVLPAAGGSLGLLHASRDAVEPLQTWDLDHGREPYAPIECWALRRGRVHRWSGSESGPLCGHWGSVDPLPYACYPLIGHGETQGVLSLVGEAERAPSPERAALEELVAETLGLAVTNMRLQETLHQQSIRDPLTGLFNRRYLEHTAERELARARRRQQPLAVVLCDLDHFKRLNDDHGHDAGDAALGQFGALLRRSLRREDVVCRYGGEEFLILMPDADATAGALRAEALRRELRSTSLKLDERPLPVLTASFGVAAYPDDGGTFEVLLRAADAALYRAKRSGRDCVRGAGTSWEGEQAAAVLAP